MARFKARPDVRGRVRFRPDPGGPRFHGSPHRERPPKPCDICALPDIERLRVDLRILSGYLGGAQYRDHLAHMAKDVVEASKFRDGTYGDVLVGELEWAMSEARSIATEARDAEKPKTALSALKTLSELVGAQAKLLGIGVPRSGKGGLHVHVASVTRDDLARLVEDYQATALPAPASETIEMEPEPPSGD